MMIHHTQDSTGSAIPSSKPWALTPDEVAAVAGGQRPEFIDVQIPMQPIYLDELVG